MRSREIRFDSYLLRLETLSHREQVEPIGLGDTHSAILRGKAFDVYSRLDEAEASNYNNNINNV